MRHLVKTRTIAQIDTEVSINGENVDDFLGDVCDLAHQALIELSMYRQEHGLSEDEFDNIESKFCALLNKLGD